MKTIWRIWVTLSLLYIQFGGGHHWGVWRSLAWAAADDVTYYFDGNRTTVTWVTDPRDIVVTPCNRDGSCGQ